MTGKPGMKGVGLGGARPGAGRPRGSGSGNDKGRPLGALDKSLSPARLVPRAEKWNFAEIVYQYAEEMLARMVDLARNAESEVVRLAAQDKILDAAFSESSADKIAGDLRSAGVK